MDSSGERNEPSINSKSWRMHMSFVTKILRDETGATAIEYGLIAALIAVAIMTTIGGLGTELDKTFSKTSSSLSSTNA